MQVIIRPMDWEKKIADGIPKDAEDIMKYFNLAIDRKAYPYVPRLSKITKEEIKDLWYPSREQNITFVAEISGRVVGAGTILIEPSSNKYSKEVGRDNKEYSVTINPSYIRKGIGALITKAIIEDARKKGIKFQSHVSVENEGAIKMMQKLGYSPTRTIENCERYYKAGLNPRVYLYELP